MFPLHILQSKLIKSVILIDKILKKCYFFLKTLQI